MAYNFADEPEDYVRPTTNHSPEPPEGTKLVQEYLFEESYLKPHWCYLYIMVDEDSSRAEIQKEYDWWEESLAGWKPPLSLRKATWEVLAYLEELLESH